MTQLEVAMGVDPLDPRNYETLASMAAIRISLLVATPRFGRRPPFGGGRILFLRNAFYFTPWPIGPIIA